MEREYRGMTTNEVIEQIKAGHISFADIADYLNDRTDAERRNFCFRMFCSIPMEPITISMESFRDYDAIPYSKKHKPSYHEVKSTGLTPQQESEKDRLLNAIGFIESKYGVDLFGEYQDERTFKPTDDEAKELTKCEYPELPKELQSDDAKELLERLVNNGYCEENTYKWKGTKYGAAHAANHISKILNLKKKWKIFQSLWGFKNMAQTLYKVDIEANQDEMKDIDRLFPENAPTLTKKI